MLAYLFFFVFFYNNHLHFKEQAQFFHLTGDYFVSKMSCPGGFSGYLGEFLTQFYFLSLAGPFIITLLLLVIQQTAICCYLDIPSFNNVVSGTSCFRLYLLNICLYMYCWHYIHMEKITGNKRNNS